MGPNEIIQLLYLTEKHGVPLMIKIIQELQKTEEDVTYENVKRLGESRFNWGAGDLPETEPEA